MVWERGPFTACPSCGQEAFGLLSAGGDRMILRCSNCRYSEAVELPPQDKAVIYLDQFAFSGLFAVESGRKLPDGHEAFFTELHARLRRLVLLQRIVMPHSDIHTTETIVHRDPTGLKRATELIGGGLSFKPSKTIQLEQMWEYATAYIEKRDPALDLTVDRIIEGDRNGWLSDLHITVDGNYGHFADGLRQVRDQTHTEMQQLVAHWAAEKPSFAVALEKELSVFGRSRGQAVVAAINRLEAAARGEDGLAFAVASLEPILTEFSLLREAFAKQVGDEASTKAVRAFWDWEKTRSQPHNWISAHMFASLANRVANGQRKITRGFINDVEAISTYAPYVDALFLDRECAAILQAEPVAGALQLGEKVFSLSDGQAFLDYLDALERTVTAETRQFAARIYGVK